MRTIEFRATTKSGKWVYGYLSRCDGEFIIDDDDGFGVFINRKTIGEYTNRRDRNSKKIYEGDILKCKLNDGSYENYAVEWDYDSCGFVAYNKDKSNFMDCSIWDEFEIIGNIHENPRLL